jgi:hypothetical protein
LVEHWLPKPGVAGSSPVVRFFSQKPENPPQALRFLNARPRSAVVASEVDANTGVTFPRGETMRKRSFFAAAACTLAIAGTGAGAALAGEVQGPPGTPGVFGSGSGNQTGAFSNSNSICSFNGLNDMNQGPLDSIVQTPHTQGVPGEAGHGTCAGGTNFERTK